MTGINQFNVTVATTSTPLCGPNPRRVALILSSGPTNHFTVSWLPTAVILQGITLWPADRPFVIDRREIGEAVKGPLSAISDTAQQVVTVIEITDGP